MVITHTRARSLCANVRKTLRKPEPVSDVPINYGMKTQQNKPDAYHAKHTLCGDLSKRFHFLEPGNDLVPTRNALGRQT